MENRALQIKLFHVVSLDLCDVEGDVILVTANHRWVLGSTLHKNLVTTRLLNLRPIALIFHAIYSYATQSRVFVPVKFKARSTIVMLTASLLRLFTIDGLSSTDSTEEGMPETAGA